MDTHGQVARAATYTGRKRGKRTFEVQIRAHGDSFQPPASLHDAINPAVHLLRATDLTSVSYPKEPPAGVV